MTIFKYIIWHYTKAPIEFFKIWGNFLAFFWSHLFSVPTLLKTLFSPWKRTGVSRTDSLDPKTLLQKFGMSLVSRFVGLFVKLFTLLLALAVEVVVLISPLFFLAVFLLWPVFFVVAVGSFNIYAIAAAILFGILFFVFYKLSKEKPPDEMSPEEMLKQKWAGIIWERLGLSSQKTPKDIGLFLEQNKIKKEDFKTALIWEVARQKERYLKKRFWLKENLFSIKSLTADWVYGYTPLLDQFTQKIAALANYEKSIGHVEELKVLERILSKSGQSNALIVGQPGVGKMSLVQKFNRMINAGQLNPVLNHRRVLFLRLEEALAGLDTEGQLTKRLITIFNQAKGAGNVILIINDLHNFIKFSQTIIPFLKGGYFQLVATTTYEGLHEKLEKHPELMKFFEKVEVKEPDKKTTEKICQDSVREIEERIPVRITVQTIKKIVDKADVFITDTPFPEKALDLLEETAIYTAKEAQDYLVKPEHINKVISQKTEIPTGDLEKGEKEKLLNLEEIMHKRVINQATAINDIASAMRRARLEITGKNRPIGSFLFIGPTGVGKTETAKTLAEVYFGSEKRMNRFDMSEFQGPDAMTKMIGSRNTGKLGLLTTAVKEDPFSLLLLDEIEKADYGVLNLFLQVLEEGWLTDAMGRKINFRNQIIIATSNAGAEYIRQKITDEKSEDENLKKELLNLVLQKGIFRPEFLNRFDGVILFRPLNHEHLLKIATLMLNSLKKRLAKKELIFEFDPANSGASQELAEKIARLGYDPANGARPMRRVIQRQVEDLIAKKLLKGEIKKDSPFKITADEIK